MKFFKHYKNKPYKFIGIAKHSETLDDVVIYETRYENNTAKLWVRPKEMFFSSVEVNGQAIPRFQEVPLRIQGTSEIGSEEIQSIAVIMKEAFGEWDRKYFDATFNYRKTFQLFIAEVEGKPVGFKLGYEQSEGEFYSWLGGVLPEYRGLGIAADLMKAQHDWCRKHGYQKIQTKTQNRFREMLLLNLKFGFDVIGLHTSTSGEPKIILEKRL